jgi:methylglyoxal synthase
MSNHPLSPGLKSIAFVAHDNCKAKLIDWVDRHQDTFAGLELYATGTTGKKLNARSGLPVSCLNSGPLGGDQQIGALISEGKIDMLIFFWDPLEPMSHDPDIKALLRLATLWNIPYACNEATAELLVNSPGFQSYQPQRPDFSDYVNRPIKT